MHEVRRHHHPGRTRDGHWLVLTSWPTAYRCLPRVGDADDSTDSTLDQIQDCTCVEFCDEDPKTELGIEHGPKWITDPTVAGDVSAALEKAIPGGDFIQVKLGIPLAVVPIVIAASWQLAGFAMANFLAALGTMPEELREAASLDGAGTWRYHWHIVLPWLRPMIVVVLILLGHVSLKSFDLVYTMSGQGPGFATDVPGIFVFDQTFRALRYNTGAAAAVVMLLMVAAVMVPYLYRSVLREKKS